MHRKNCVLLEYRSFRAIFWQMENSLLIKTGQNDLCGENDLRVGHKKVEKVFNEVP